MCILKFIKEYSPDFFLINKEFSGLKDLGLPENISTLMLFEKGKYAIYAFDFTKKCLNPLYLGQN